MRRTLEDLYFGNITPNEQKMTPDSELKKAVDRVVRYENQLTELLDENGQSILTKLIRSQKAMLRDFAEKNGFLDYEYYVDDGYTGRNFNRPSFQRMIADIEAGKVKCVITKDLSRLGRNYIEAGSYMEV